MRSTMRLISIAGILLMPSLGLVEPASAAGLLVEVKPNPGTVGTAVTVTIMAAQEGVIYLYSPCDLLVDFGDNTKKNIGKLTTSTGGALSKSTTHTYLTAKIYTITVSPLNCDAAKNTANTVKTTVTIQPRRTVTRPLPGS